MRNRKEGCWTTFWLLTCILGSKIPLHPNQSKKNSCKFILQSFSAHFALASYSMVSVQEGSRCTVWSLAFNCFYLQLFTNPSDGRYLRERERESFSLTCLTLSFLCFCVHRETWKTLPMSVRYVWSFPTWVLDILQFADSLFFLCSSLQASDGITKNIFQWLMVVKGLLKSMCEKSITPSAQGPWRVPWALWVKRRG